MYFMPKRHRLYAWVAHIAPRYRYMITFSGLCGAGALWWFCIYQPITKTIASYMATGCSFEKQSMMYLKKQNNTQDVAYLTDLRQEIDAYKQDSLEQQKQCAQVLMCAQQAGLYVRSYAKQHEKQKDWYASSPIQFSFTGSLEQIDSFLTQLHNLRQLMTCTHIQYVRTEQDTYMCTCLIKILHIS